MVGQSLLQSEIMGKVFAFLIRSPFPVVSGPPDVDAKFKSRLSWIDREEVRKDDDLVLGSVFRQSKRRKTSKRETLTLLGPSAIVVVCWTHTLEDYNLERSLFDRD